MDGINFKVIGKLLDHVDTEHLPKVERAAIAGAANQLVHNIREALTNQYNKVTEQNPKYNDRMIDAVRFGYIIGAATTVHAYGTRDTGSGTYRTRFLAGTKPRYQKKPKKYLGKIATNNWFERGTEQGEDKAAAIMEEIFSKYIENYY